MRRTIGLALPVFLVFSAAHAADMRTENRNLPPFDAISADGALELEVTAGKGQSVRVSSEGNPAERVETSVSGGVLRIKTRHQMFWNGKIRVQVTLPRLTRLDLDGAGTIKAMGVDADDFRMTLDGAGSATLSGRCGHARLKIDGAGSLDASGLKCKDVAAKLDGAGSIKAYASASADASLDGVGNIEIYGNPKHVQKNSGGIGHITVKNGEEH